MPSPGEGAGRERGRGPGGPRRPGGRRGRPVPVELCVPAGRHRPVGGGGAPGRPVGDSRAGGQQPGGRAGRGRAGGTWDPHAPAGPGWGAPAPPHPCRAGQGDPAPHAQPTLGGTGAPTASPTAPGRTLLRGPGVTLARASPDSPPPHSCGDPVTRPAELSARPPSCAPDPLAGRASWGAQVPAPEGERSMVYAEE